MGNWGGFLDLDLWERVEWIRSLGFWRKTGWVSGDNPLLYGIGDLRVKVGLCIQLSNESTKHNEEEEELKNSIGKHIIVLPA